jgi:uncharacterized membrane protein YqjE
VKGIVHDHFLLATLEIKKARASFIAMVIYGVLAALLFVTSWLTLLATLLLWATARGLPWVAALLLTVAMNLCVAIGFVIAIRKRSQDLLLPATLRQLSPVKHDSRG